MIYRRRTYRVEPERAEAFNAFFNEHLLEAAGVVGVAGVAQAVSVRLSTTAAASAANFTPRV